MTPHRLIIGLAVLFFAVVVFVACGLGYLGFIWYEVNKPNPDVSGK
jgi:hypothetical protein